MSRNRWSLSQTESNPRGSARSAQPSRGSHRRGDSPGTEKSYWGRARPRSTGCQPTEVLACVVNVSEGRDRRVVDAIAAAAGACLLDVHTDPHHNRAVLTLAGQGVEAAARAVAAEGVRRIDLRLHVGVHPRLGAVDVVPFVPLGGASMAAAVAARDRF